MHPNVALVYEILALVMILIASCYLVAVLKFPSLLLPMFAIEISRYQTQPLCYGYVRPSWRRKIFCWAVFISFAFPMCWGFARLGRASIASSWGETLSSIFVVLPILLCGLGGAVAVIHCGWLAASAVHDQLARDNQKRMDDELNASLRAKRLEREARDRED